MPGLPLGPGGVIINNPVPDPPFGGAGGVLLNQSNIGPNQAKLQSMPPYLVECEPYRESWTRERQQITRTFNCPWSGADVAIQWLLGYSTSIVDPNDNTKGLLQRVMPAQNYLFPWLYCTSVNLVQGKGSITLDPSVVLTDGSGQPVLDANGNPIPAPYIAYVEAQTGSDGIATFETTWEPLPYNILDDATAYDNPLLEMSRYVERSIIFSIQAQSIPATYQMQFLNPPVQTYPTPPYVGGGGSPGLHTTVPGNPIFLIPTQSLTYRWLDVPDLPLTGINNCIGCVNKNNFDGAAGWPTFPAATLLCQAPQIERHRNIVGRVSWDVVYHFDYRPGGWNSFLWTDRNYYAAGFQGLEALPLFPIADFSQLFVAPPPVTYQ